MEYRNHQWVFVKEARSGQGQEGGSSNERVLEGPSSEAARREHYEAQRNVAKYLADEAAANRRYRQAASALIRSERFAELHTVASMKRIELKPAGTAFFSLLGRDGEDGLQSLADRLDTRARYYPQGLAFEDAYRTMYLLKAASASKGAEDARFLADQAALALERGPILVRVPDPPDGGAVLRQRVEKFIQALANADRAQAKLLALRGEVSGVQAELERKGEIVRQNEAQRMDLKRGIDLLHIKSPEGAKPEVVRSLGENLRKAEESLKNAKADEHELKGQAEKMVLLEEEAKIAYEKILRELSEMARE